MALKTDRFSYVVTLPLGGAVKQTEQTPMLPCFIGLLIVLTCPGSEGQVPLPPGYSFLMFVRQKNRQVLILITVTKCPDFRSAQIVEHIYTHGGQQNYFQGGTHAYTHY